MIHAGDMSVTASIRAMLILISREPSLSHWRQWVLSPLFTITSSEEVRFFVSLPPPWPDEDVITRVIATENP